MAIFYLPVIAQQDYQSFRGLPRNDFPNTYDEWLQLSRDQATNWQSKGYLVERMEVRADKFRRYCDAGGTPCNMHMLYALAADQGIGKY